MGFKPLINQVTVVKLSLISIPTSNSLEWWSIAGRNYARLSDFIQQLRSQRVRMSVTFLVILVIFYRHVQMPSELGQLGWQWLRHAFHAFASALRCRLFPLPLPISFVCVYRSVCVYVCVCLCVCVWAGVLFCLTHLDVFSSVPQREPTGVT